MYGRIGLKRKPHQNDGTPELAKPPRIRVRYPWQLGKRYAQSEFFSV